MEALALDFDEKIGVRSRSLRHALLSKLVPLSKCNTHSLEGFVHDFHARTGLALCSVEPAWVLPDDSVDPTRVDLGFCRPLETVVTRPQGPRSAVMCTHPWLLSPRCAQERLTAADLDVWSVFVVRGLRAGLEPFVSLQSLSHQPLNCLRLIKDLDLDLKIEVLPREVVRDAVLDLASAAKCDLSLHVHEADRAAALGLCALSAPLQQDALRTEREAVAQLFASELASQLTPYVAPGKLVGQRGDSGPELY